MLKKTIDDCQRLAYDRGGECLSQEYVNNSTKMSWMCSKGHHWKATYNNISKGKWCPICADTTKSIEDCRSLAHEKGGECLSERYINAGSKLLWRCSRGHEWMATYRSINQYSWCPECYSIRRRNSIEDCVAIAMSNGGKCLSKEYTNNYTKLRWECSIGHRWFASYDKIKVGHWCHQCKNKSQTKLFNIIKKIFPKNKIHYNYKKFDWLKTESGGTQEIDIFVEGVLLGIEYDGRQHFVPIDCWGGEKSLAKTKQRDAVKNNKIKQHPEEIKYFVRISYKDDLNKDNIIRKLKKIGVI